MDSAPLGGGVGPSRMLDHDGSKAIYNETDRKKREWFSRLDTICHGVEIKALSPCEGSTALRSVHRRRGATSVLVPTLRGGAESRATSTARKNRPLRLGVLTSGLSACLSGLLDPYISHLFLLLLLLLLGHVVLRSLFGSDEPRISSNHRGFITFRQLVASHSSYPEFHLASEPEPESLDEVSNGCGDNYRSDRVFRLTDHP